MDLWYVIQTKHRKEEEANSFLSQKGVEIFAPLIETFTARNGRICKELAPLFPGYIFGNFDLIQNYPLVRWARGVQRVLGFGDYPTPISEDAINIIKMRTDCNGIVKRVKHFKTNDVVRITSGPLKDLIGIFERWVSDGERVRILLNLISFQPVVEIHYSIVEKVA